MNDKDKDAGGLAAARRMRGPAAARHFDAEHADRRMADAADDNRQAYEWAELLADKMVTMTEPGGPSQIEWFRNGAIRYMRPVVERMEASTKRRIARAEQKLQDHYQAEIKKLRALIEELQGPR